MNKYQFFEGEEDILNWWNSLDKNRGDRAKLRRATKPEDVLLSESFFKFLQQMPGEWADEGHLLTSAIIASVLAHVKQPDNQYDFAKQLAMPKEKNGKARVSELRFEQLQKSRDPAEFYKRLIRVIHLIGCTANIYSLTDSILLWMKEYQEGLDREPQNRLAIKWATEYYTQIMENDKKSGGKKQ